MAPARPLQDVEQGCTSDIPTRIPDGSMTIQELSHWIRAAPVAIQDSVITDICWWEESETVLKHQFLALRFRYAGSVHELSLERAGKVIMDPFRRAMDKATFKPVTQDYNPSFYNSHRLLFGLLTDKNIAPEGSFCFDAFVDFLDYKWAGPYPRLRDLGRYVEVISAEEPRYSLTSSNCYWFSRLVFHTLALRHYAFPFVVSSIRTRSYVVPRTAKSTTLHTDQINDEDWRHHDPSSVGLVFRFLHYEEWRNGILMFRRIIIASVAFLFLAVTMASGYGLYQLARDSPHPASKSCLIAIVGVLLFSVPFSVLGGSILVLWIVARLTYCLIRRKTVRMLEIFDRGSDAESIRGDCIPPNLPWYRELQDLRLEVGGEMQAQTIFIRKTPPPRKMPNPWRHDKQIYAGKKDEYLLALAEMRKTELKQRARYQGMVERSSAKPVPHMAEAV
ncbi:hypothetical protein C8F01DRAFT_1252987 [Mycena amicta]|nr:hypothetical protein C8F01DRAFT_1252987 [Mycena amicta]